MLSEIFTKFANNYIAATKTPFEGSEVADEIRNEIPEVLARLAVIPRSYKVYGSAGQGQWAGIPWVAVLDRSISESTKLGYYIVFLFSADMTQMHLTLVLGWEQYENELGVRDGGILIERTVKQLQRVLRSPLDEFSFSKSDLKATTSLGKGYESGGI